MPSILLLDDEPNVLAALRRTLRRPLGEGVMVVTCTDPHEALRLVGEQPFDVVASDFRMPAMNGVQFLSFVRELQPHAIRIVVSASTEIDGVMSAVNDVGVYRYIVKPWNPELLAHDFASALAEAAAQREQRRLADEMRAARGELDPRAAELRRLEEMEPGLTQVQWGEHGEVLMPTLPAAL